VVYGCFLDPSFIVLRCEVSVLPRDSATVHACKNDKDVIVYNEELFKIGFDLGNTLLIMAKALVIERYRKLIWGTDRRALPTRNDIKGLETTFYAIEGKKRK